MINPSSAFQHTRANVGRAEWKQEEGMEKIWTVVCERQKLKASPLSEARAHTCSCTVVETRRCWHLLLGELLLTPCRMSRLRLQTSRQSHILESHLDSHRQPPGNTKHFVYIYIYIITLCICIYIYIYMYIFLYIPFNIFLFTKHLN